MPRNASRRLAATYHNSLLATQSFFPESSIKRSNCEGRFQSNQMNTHITLVLSSNQRTQIVMNHQIGSANVGCHNSGFNTEGTEDRIFRKAVEPHLSFQVWSSMPITSVTFILSKEKTQTITPKQKCGLINQKSKNSWWKVLCKGRVKSQMITQFRLLSEQSTF